MSFRPNLRDSQKMIIEPISCPITAYVTPSTVPQAMPAAIERRVRDRRDHHRHREDGDEQHRSPEAEVADPLADVLDIEVAGDELRGDEDAGNKQRRHAE